MFWRKLWLALGRPPVRPNGTAHPVMSRWFEHQCWYPPERWEAALRELVASGVVPRGGGYLESIAGRPDLQVDPPTPPDAPAVASAPVRPVRVNASVQRREEVIEQFRRRAEERRKAKAQEEANGKCS